MKGPLLSVLGNYGWRRQARHRPFGWGIRPVQPSDVRSAPPSQVDSRPEGTHIAARANQMGSPSKIGSLIQASHQFGSHVTEGGRDWKWSSSSPRPPENAKMLVWAHGPADVHGKFRGTKDVRRPTATLESRTMLGRIACKQCAVSKRCATPDTKARPRKREAAPNPHDQ